ncbi:MAG: Ger(x)C family spore germination protein [Clostridia bacterium]|nr:Ger(x)C family spore germination protein [Clostridia bacterium]
MNFKKIKVFAASLIMLYVILFSSGCWDALDLNERSIVTTVLLDYNEDKIIFYIEMANPDKATTNGSGGGSEDKYLVVKSVGKDFVEARNNANEKMDKPVYLSAVRSIVMTERFAKLHFIEYLHRFRSDENYRKKIDTVITRDEPEELLKITKEKKQSLGFVTEDIIETLEEQGKSFKRTTMRLLENISAKYTGMLIPCMGISEEEIALVGYSVVNNNKVDGFLPVEEIEGMILLKAEKVKTNYRLHYNDMNMTVKVTQKKRTIKANYDNEQISMDVNMEYKAELLYGDKKEPYNFQEEDAKALGELLKERIKEELAEAIGRSQTEFNCDYYQFDDEFRIKYPIEFDRMDWYEEYPKIKFNYNIKVKLGTVWIMDYSNDEAK